MRVGYTIVSLSPSSQEKQFAEFLRNTLILEEGYADNISAIVANGDPVNIYTQRDLNFEGYEFSLDYQEITVEQGEYLVASAVDFRLEVQFQGGIKVLAPTEYFITTEELAKTLYKEVNQGLLKVFPDFSFIGTEWILADNDWNDGGTWIDNDDWKD